MVQHHCGERRRRSHSPLHAADSRRTRFELGTARRTRVGGLHRGYRPGRDHHDAQTPGQNPRVRHRAAAAENLLHHWNNVPGPYRIAAIQETEHFAPLSRWLPPIISPIRANTSIAATAFPSSFSRMWRAPDVFGRVHHHHRRADEASRSHQRSVLGQ